MLICDDKRVKIFNTYVYNLLDYIGALDLCADFWDSVQACLCVCVCVSGQAQTDVFVSLCCFPFFVSCCCLDSIGLLEIGINVAVRRHPLYSDTKPL